MATFNIGKISTSALNLNTTQIEFFEKFADTESGIARQDHDSDKPFRFKKENIIDIARFAMTDGILKQQKEVSEGPIIDARDMTYWTYKDGKWSSEKYDGQDDFIIKDHIYLDPLTRRMYVYTPDGELISANKGKPDEDQQ